MPIANLEHKERYGKVGRIQRTDDDEWGKRCRGKQPVGRRTPYACVDDKCKVEGKAFP